MIAGLGSAEEEESVDEKLKKYVGRIVRLKQDVFLQIKARARHHGAALENSFLVTEVKAGVRKLVCYGNSYRVEVAIADVVLV